MFSRKIIFRALLCKVALATMLACAPLARAQQTNPGVQQSGAVTFGDCVRWGPGVGQIRTAGAPCITGTPAALSKTDDTNVTLTLTGTPATALLQAVGLQLGWTGTLAAARLNSNVVQSVVNDTNVTGSIAAQALTLGWTGTLAYARGGCNAATQVACRNNIFPTPTRAGDIAYWDGAQWLTLAGNNSGTKFLQEDASGVPSWASAAGTVTSIAQGANTTANPGAGVALSTNPCTATCTVSIDASYMRGYWSGCQMSAGGGTTTLTITACVTTSDDFTTLMKVTSTYTKLMSSTWTVGSGGGCLDTGATAANTWYHGFQIIRTDTGVSDYICSLSATAPTMPANYTPKRRIGSFKTDGSSNIIAFTQNYDLFAWSVPVTDLNQTNPTSGSRQTVTLASVPTGVVVEPNLQWGGDNTTANFNAIVTSLAMADTAPSATLNSFRVAGTGTNAWAGSNIRVVTNTSAQIGYRVDATGASNRITAVTYGWRDYLGR